MMGPRKNGLNLILAYYGLNTTILLFSPHWVMVIRRDIGEYTGKKSG
jgi:hypothetical protein